ncbi:MAG: CDP-alcohol phosphatidyltransferase family protein [Phycisphaerales bacterium]
MSALPNAPDPQATTAGGFRGTIPNTLTALRVVVAVVFFAVLTYWRFEASAAWNGQTDWWLILAAALFIVAGLTDILDGFLARRWGVESTFGRIMDPFADKLLVVGALIFLAGPDFWHRTPEMHALSGHGIQISGVYPWMVVLIFGRELLVTSIRGVLEGQGVRFGADWSGKLKMFCQSVCVPTCLITIAVTRVVARPDGEAPWGRWTIDITVWVTLAVTAVSTVPYVLRCASLVARWHAGRAR